jgi:uncharacterized membrane protein YdjX (TVP38/TMEM64 family)
MSRALVLTVTAVGLLAIVLSAWLIDLSAFHDRAASAPGVAVFALVALLPLVGVPVSLLYAVAGAKFGRTWGMVLAAAAIALHLVGSWWIAHSWLERPLDALFRKTRWRKPQVPPGEEVPICLLVSLVPGAPYTVKNYLLVLGGVPFAPFFWTCLPAHLLHASTAIFFGDFTAEFTRPRIIFLVVYSLVVAVLTRYVIHRLRARRQQVGS